MANDKTYIKVELHHNDRLVFGSTQLWVFQNPKEKDIGSVGFLFINIIT